MDVSCVSIPYHTWLCIQGLVGFSGRHWFSKPFLSCLVGMWICKYQDIQTSTGGCLAVCICYLIYTAISCRSVVVLSSICHGPQEHYTHLYQNVWTMKTRYNIWNHFDIISTMQYQIQVNLHAEPKLLTCIIWLIGDYVHMMRWKNCWARPAWTSQQAIREEEIENIRRIIYVSVAI